MIARSAAGGYDARYAVGDIPNIRLKLVVNDPTDESPTLMQISATFQSVSRRSAAARSSRRVSKYAWGESPYARRNTAEKWARERPAARARSSTVKGSA